MADQFFTPKEPGLPVLEKKKFLQNKKLVIASVVLVLAVVAVVIILVLQFNKETIEKTSLLFPFFFRKR